MQNRPHISAQTVHIKAYSTFSIIASIVARLMFDLKSVFIERFGQVRLFCTCLQFFPMTLV